MKKYLFLLVLGAFTFISCNDDELTLEEMKAALIGEWEYLEEGSYGVSSYWGCPLIFNADGTGAELQWKSDAHEQEYVDFTYELVQISQEVLGKYDTGLYLYITSLRNGVKSSRYVLELTPNYLEWKSSPITCDVPKKYKKVK